MLGITEDLSRVEIPLKELLINNESNFTKALERRGITRQQVVDAYQTIEKRTYTIVYKIVKGRKPIMNEESKMRNERGCAIQSPSVGLTACLKEPNVSEELDIIEHKLCEIKEFLLPPYQKLSNSENVAPCNSGLANSIDKNDIFQKLNSITDLLGRLRVLATGIERRV